MTKIRQTSYYSKCNYFKYPGQVTYVKILIFVGHLARPIGIIPCRLRIIEIS
jgi:hypothetical protein